MRVAIDLLITEKEPAGMLWAARVLLAGLARIDQKNEYIIITTRPQDYQALATAPNMRIHVVKLRSCKGLLIQHQLLLPNILRLIRPDVLHVPAFAAPIGWHGPLVMTVHDLAFLKVAEQPSLYARLYWQYLLRESVQRAQRIIAVSQQTRDELITRWTIQPERIHIIHNPLRPSLPYADIPAEEIQTQLFTIEACAEATCRVYQEACGLNEPLRPSASVGTRQRATLTQSAPSASVIVPTTRAEQASQTLESICHQRYQGEIEIIVVGLCAGELAQRWPVTPVNPGCLCAPGRARNLGALHAHGDVLLFLDDDCVVAEDWVERNVLALQQPQAGAVGARISGKSRAFFARCTDFVNFGYYQHGHSMDVPVAAASMAVVQTVFHTVGGFDDTLRFGEDEDIDLCHRIQKQGYRTVYQPNIVVIHDHRRDTLGKLLRYNYAHGLASGLTTKIRHKEIGLKNRLLYSVRFPPLFLLLLPFIAIAATARIVVMNVPENWDVLLHAPFIFLAKLAYECGVFRWLTLPRAKTEGLSGESLPNQVS